MAKNKWYNDGENEIYIPSNDPVPTGFNPGRISKIIELSKQISKELLYKLYIIENHSFNEVFGELNISRKDLRRLLTFYRISKSPKESRKNNHYRRSREEIETVAKKSSETQKKRWESVSSEYKNLVSQKRRATMLNLPQETKERKSDSYRIYWNSLSDTQKKEINEKRSISCKEIWKNPEVRKKQHETAERNRVIQKKKLCRTISEQKLYEVLKAHYDDVKYDVIVDDRYPYYCDFYLPSLDVFIELQAHPSHGRLPIEMLNVNEYSLYKNSWVDTFARRDVEKLETAKKSGIYLLRIYPSATLQQNYDINKNIEKKLVDICYSSQK